ncbi:hypothetical protein ACFYNO_10160 [Kitasatospora sp. NPDC006697]|uniref:LppU/SCO3897 family protein n=1 Tax=Kitasatospora sp. NPDC006697 TaxID=3364020 RepID=UPI0036AA9CF3
MSTPPPPQGQYPPPQGGGFGPPPGAYGAPGPQAPQGYAPPPQQGYLPPQQGYAQPGQPYGQPMPPQYPNPGFVTPPAKPRRGPRIILGIVVVVVLAVIGVFAVNSAKHDPKYASVGDCVHNKNGSVAAGGTDDHPDVVTIACTDPNADAKIVGKVHGSGDPDTNCKQFSDADGYYTQKQGSEDFTLCLKFLKQ